MKRPRVYLAAGWFNPAQRKQMEEIHKCLNYFALNRKIDLFAPFYDGIVLKGRTDPEHRAKMKQAWELDIKKLSRSDLIVASTQDHDVGTIFECGHGSAKGIPILCYNSNPELGLNVMLSQEAKGFCKTEATLAEAINSFLKYFNSPDFGNDSWRYNIWEGEPI